MKILINAYACEPHCGSEPGVGWNWVSHLSKYCKLDVLTSPEHRDNILQNLNDLVRPENVTFYFPEIYKDIDQYIWKKNRILHHYLWQRKTYHFLKNNPSILNSSDIIHHLTYNGFREYDLLWKFNNKKYIWGPVGGAQDPIFLNSGIWGISLPFEIIRQTINYIALNYSINVKQALKRSSIVFVADTTTLRKLPNDFKEKYYLMLETGVNKEQVVKRKLSICEGRVQVIWSGLLVPRKGFPILIKVAQETKDYADFIVYGDGKLKDRYLKEIMKIGIKNIKFVGKVSYAEMQKAYFEAHLFLFTSLRDTSGNVVIEAMAKGIPTIVINQHGAADIVGPKGLRVNPISIESIVTNIKKIIIDRYNNESYFQEIVNYQYSRLSNYYWTTKAKKMYELYKSIRNENTPNTQ